MVIPLPAANCNVHSARYAPTNDSLDSFFFYSDGKSPKCSSLTRDPVRDKILHFYHATTALRCHFVVFDVFFLCGPYVTRYN